MAKSKPVTVSTDHATPEIAKPQAAPPAEPAAPPTELTTDREALIEIHALASEPALWEEAMRQKLIHIKHVTGKALTKPQAPAAQPPTTASTPAKAPAPDASNGGVEPESPTSDATA